MISSTRNVFRSAIAVVALVAGFVVLMRAATAQEEGKLDTEQDAAFTQRLFAAVPGKDKTYVCFTRVYDPAHLAAHPKQKVSAMKLLVTSEQSEEDKTWQSFSFRLGLKYRTRSGAFDSSGNCGHASITEETKGQPRISCGVDCDGGGISFGLTPDNKSAMLYVERVRIWRDNRPDDEASTSLVGGADDKVFRLDRTKLDECASLVEDRKELAAMRSIAHKR
jgi:hypothetical protein